MNNLVVGASGSPSRVMFIYLGRRGFSSFALDVARAAVADDTITATIVVSRQNGSYASFAELKEAHLPLDTFKTNAGALLHSWRIPAIRRRLKGAIDQHKPDMIVELMPHAWSPFIASVFRNAGVRYVVIIHDAMPHPGDYRTLSIQWLSRRTFHQADAVLTLSGSVASNLIASGAVPAEMVRTLFLPTLNIRGSQPIDSPKVGRSLRLVFFGRIMAYKGLPLFLDMIELLRNRGISVDFAIFGEGDLGANKKRIAAMGAEVINRWLTEAEIGTLLPRFHAMVLSHVEASQSGVAAVALGVGLPVIATPVGGIPEQITDGVTGLVAKRPDASALADAAELLLTEPNLHRHICSQIAARKEDRSSARFVKEVADLFR